MRILVCDDNVDAAATLGLLLGGRHEVYLCHDGRSCVEKARGWRPHVALLDIGMPDMTGYAVAAAIRKMEFGSDVLLVAITGYSLPEYKRVAQDAGFDLYLTKPADLETLLGAVNGREARRA
jgi:CheY-like chemotaxis protein